MNIESLCTFAFVMMTISAAGGTPAWVEQAGKSPSYPDSVYVTGYGIFYRTEGVDVAKAAGSAVEVAKKNLIEKIRVRITAVTSTKSEESGERYASFYSSAVQSTSNIEIDGMAIERYDDGERYHALVTVKRSEMSAAYRYKVEKYRSELEGKMKLAKLFEQQKKDALAVREYFACYPVLRQMEEAQSILSSLMVGATEVDMLNAAATNEVTASRIRETIVRLTDRPIESVEDLSRSITHILFEQVRSEDLPIAIQPMQYEDTKMGSSFSRYFASLLEQHCSDIAHWRMVGSGHEAVLSGSYWENTHTIKFIVTLRDADDGTIIGSAEQSVPKEVISRTGKDLAPRNVRQALTDTRIFQENEGGTGGLTVEAWTNRTNSGDLFVNGDKMNVTVKVNMPCYLRFIYHMADGKRVLLMNEYFVDASKVNTPFRLPNTFECSAPFGSEVLQVFARTDRYETLATRTKDGYQYLAEDLSTIIAKTRGMKEVAAQVLQAEARITITTVQD